MKIIHTSDLHIGHMLYSVERQTEQTALFDQLAKIVAAEEPDALIICGDVYHVSAPSASAQKIFTEGMIKVHEARPSMTIVAIAGNHDSASRLEADSSLWRRLNVHVVGELARDDNRQIDASKHIIELPGNLGYVVAVPFVHPFYNKSADIFPNIMSEVERLNASKQRPVVLMAHTALRIVGREPDADEQEGVGGLDYDTLDSFGTGWDYLALGHIHHKGAVDPKDPNKARYCGTPLAINFTETTDREVLSVEVTHGQSPIVKHIKMSLPWPLMNIPNTPLPLDEALDELRKIPNDLEANIRLLVKVDKYLASNANALVDEAMKGKAAHLCRIEPVFETTQVSDDSKEQKHLSTAQINKLSVVDIAKMIFANLNEELSESNIDLLKELELIARNDN